eukprot:353088-Chlamydomonas_euryale.AAC.6
MAKGGWVCKHGHRTCVYTMTPKLPACSLMERLSVVAPRGPLAGRMMHVPTGTSGDCSCSEAACKRVKRAGRARQVRGCWAEVVDGRQAGGWRRADGRAAPGTNGCVSGV